MPMRSFLTASCLVCAAVVGGPAIAQQAAEQAIDGVSMSDPEARLQQQRESSGFDFSMRDSSARTLPGPELVNAPADSDLRQVELEFAATGEHAGVPLDVSVARRQALRADSNGEINGSSGGSELRVGRGLVQRDEDEAQQGRSVYAFVASDDEALTWRPGQANPGRGSSLALQEDRVEVGDMSAGVTYERNGVQASLAYVQREVSTTVGRQSFSQDESFAGLTVTMRR